MSRSPTGFEHEALLYGDGLEGFVEAVAPLVGEMLARGGSAAVAAPTDRVARLASLFGEQERVELIDMTALGANPARIIPAWRDLADAALLSGAPFLGVGEPVWVGRTAAEIDECHRHEALINVAFGSDPSWRLVCPYDLDGLGDEVIADAHATHPVVHAADGGSRLAQIDGTTAFAALERSLPSVPDDATILTFGVEDLRSLRHLAAEMARAAGLSAQRTDDLTVVICELASNSIRHGRSARTLAIWERPGVVTCQTSNGGLIGDVLVGRRRPNPHQPGGRGVWIMHQLCDLVQIRSSVDGTVVRATVR